MKHSIWILLLVLSGALIACNGDNDEPEFGEELAQTWEDMRDAFVEEAQGRLDEAESKIDELRDENGDEEVLGEAEAIADDIRENLIELQEKGEEEWQDLEFEISQQLEELEEMLDE